ncbi:STAS-like domain-containing protein [Bradyrhizobium sp. cf659]|uniref:STAS-like domain-containing protein n=1 Tax=Bradyrhizobium sp. cf659 TaxID=1761771 RepID=UPI000B874D5A|nr:STAS-like domain-containing protein [Bradyrhizobium sp. cf659]
MALKTIQIAKTVGGGICVAASDGNKVHDEILAALRSGDRVALSFQNVSRMTTAFLNAAVGQLYGEFTEDQLKAMLAPPVHAEPWHLSRLKLVVERAKVFFRDPETARSAFLKATGLDEEE